MCDELQFRAHDPGKIPHDLDPYPDQHVTVRRHVTYHMTFCPRWSMWSIIWPYTWLVMWYISLHVEHVIAYQTEPRLDLARHPLEHSGTFHRPCAQTKTQNGLWARPNQSPKEGIVLLANDCIIWLWNHAINCGVTWLTAELRNLLIWPCLIVLFLDIWTKVVQTPHVYINPPCIKGQSPDCPSCALQQSGVNS